MLCVLVFLPLDELFTTVYSYVFIFDLSVGRA